MNTLNLKASRMTCLLACVITGLFLITPALAETTIRVNGKINGKTITVIDDAVMIDGKLVSGDLLEGSGTIASEDRNMDDFDEFVLNIKADVTITAGKQHKCTITADDNLLSLILTEVTGNRLQISSKESYSSHQKISIAIELPLIHVVNVNGSGKVSITGVTKGTLTLGINGSGTIIAKGTIEDLQASINGSGDLYGSDLESRMVNVVVNGSGNARVYAKDALRANVHGSGDITFRGSPPKVSISVKGSGSIDEE